MSDKTEYQFRESFSGSPTLRVIDNIDPNIKKVNELKVIQLKPKL